MAGAEIVPETPENLGQKLSKRGSARRPAPWRRHLDKSGQELSLLSYTNLLTRRQLLAFPNVRASKYRHGLVLIRLKSPEAQGFI